MRLLIPLLVSGVLSPIIVPLSRVGTSYKALEQGLSLVQVGILSSAFAILPILIAVQVGRHSDRSGEGGPAIAGAFLVAVSAIGLWLFSLDFWTMFGFTCLLGLGQVMLFSALQMMITRCSGPDQQDRVLGYFLVATAFGQVVGPLVIAMTTPAGATYPGEGLYWFIAASSLALVVAGIFIQFALPKHVPALEEGKIALRTIASTPGLHAVLLASGICLSTNDMVIVFLPILGADRGLDAATVGLLLSFRAGASMASRFAFARIVARMGKAGALTFSVLTAGATMAALVLPLPVWAVGTMLATSGFALGLAIACTISLTLTLAPAAGRATAMSLRLTVARLAQLLFSVSAGLGATVFGAGGVFAVMGLALVGCGAFTRRLPRAK
jgi:MFS family permease